MRLTSQNLAWAAGIVDGEGCILIEKRRSSRGGSTDFVLRLRVHMTHAATIQRLALMFGGQAKFRKSKKPGRYSDTWSWTIWSKHAETVLKSLLPFLFTKRAEADLALQFRQLPKGNRGRNRMPSNLIDARAAFRVSLQELKSCNIAKGKTKCA